MQLFALFFGLIFFGILLAGGVATFLAGLIRGWRGAAWAAATTIFAEVVIFAPMAIYFYVTDELERSLVPPEKLAGEYRAVPDSREYLNTLGYTDHSGRLELRADGTFAAAQIPVCCVDREGDHPVLGYLDFRGRWYSRMARHNAVVMLVFDDSVLEGRGSRPVGAGDEVKPHESAIELDIFSSNPRAVGFSIFRSGDFTDIVYARE